MKSNFIHNSTFRLLNPPLLPAPHKHTHTTFQQCRSNFQTKRQKVITFQNLFKATCYAYGYGPAESVCNTMQDESASLKHLHCVWPVSCTQCIQMSTNIWMDHMVECHGSWGLFLKRKTKAYQGRLWDAFLLKAGEMPCRLQSSSVIHKCVISLSKK